MRWVAFIAVLAGAGRAQTSSGSIVGDVHDAEGSAIAAAVLTARNLDTGFSRSVRSSALGAYRMDDLQPGHYALSAQRDGFKTVAVSSVTVEVDQKTRYDFELAAGSDRDTITVIAEQTPLQTDEASQGFLIGSNVMQSLPTPDRNAIGLITLGPGAIPRQLGGFTHDIMNDLQASRGAVALNAPVNGARSTGNSYILDGAANTDRNTFSVAVLPLMDTIQEMRVQSALAPAEFAGQGGAVVDIATKSGGKTFHGSAFEFLQNEATDANGFFTVAGLPRGILRQNQYGASLSGPLAKSTYYLVSYEGFRNRSSTPTEHLVPDAAVRNGDFSGRATIFNPLSLTDAGTRLPFADNVIPAGMIDPVVRKYLQQYEPLPNNPSNPAGNYIDATPSETHSDDASFRVDHSWGQRNQVFFRYTINDDRSLLAGAFPQRPTSEDLRAQQAMIGHTFSGTSSSGAWVNENRMAFTRLRVFDLPLSAFGPNVLQQLGIGGFANDPSNFGLPAFTVTDFDTVQDSNTLPQLQRDNSWYASSSFSKTQGQHTWKAGVQFTRFSMAYEQSQYARGNFEFNGTFTQDPANPGSTGDAFADFLLGFASITQRQVGTAQAYLHSNSYAAYLQDDWRVTSRLNLTVGLRYEYAAPLADSNGQLLNLAYSSLPADPVLRPVASATQPDRMGFAPRIGLAYRLPHLFSRSHSQSRETVFRAGYGIYHAPEIAVETYDLVRNGVLNVLNEPNSLLPLLTLENGFPQGASSGLPSYFGVDEHAATPYVQQWTASLQQDLPGNVLFEVAYAGSKGTHLGLFRRFNTPAHTELGLNLPPRPGDLQSLRAFPDLGTLFQIQNIGNSSYHSLQIKAEKRLSKGLAFLASFVWAKSLDDADSIVPGQFESFGAQDEGNLRLERGLSFSDVRRRFSSGFVYSIPSPAMLRQVLRGWQLSGNLTFQDGTPLNPVYFATDFANSGTPNRPNVVPGQPVLLPASQRNADHFYNPAAFSDPTPFTFGNAGRDILPGPGNVVIDAGLHRRFAIREGQALELRAEVFNLLNHPNFGIPGPYPDFGPFFGKAFSAGPPRRMQFGARFDF